MGLKSLLKRLLTQTDDKPGTAVGRLLEGATKNPLYQVGIHLGDKALEGGLKALSDDNDAPEVKEVVKEVVKNTEDDLYVFSIELLHHALESHDMPFVEGAHEDLADESVEKFVKAFIEQRKENR